MSTDQVSTNKRDSHRDAGADARPSPLANVFTIGARDLATLRRFYRQLGWPQVVDNDDYTAFELRGAVLALFPADKLSADGNVAPVEGALGRDGIRFTIGILVERAPEVDELTEVMRRAGGTVTKEPTDGEFFEGRSAYVADPEGNYWEIAWAPPTNPIVAAAGRAATGGGAT